MSERSPSLDLPFIQPAQAQKHVTHNEAVELLDMIVQLTVQAFEVNTPPPAPAEGDTWGVGTAPADAWAAHPNTLASFRGGGWMFTTPAEGWRAWDMEGEELRVFSEGIWAELDPDFDELEGLGINTTYDTTNRLSVASDASLFSHDGSGHQMKINKATATDTASLLFQSDWSGRAEMGLAGSDAFAVKVSADGATWFTGFSVSGSTGGVTLEHLLTLTPGTAPTTPAAGDVYFDATSNKLRCYDGTQWNDLW